MDEKKNTANPETKITSSTDNNSENHNNTSKRVDGPMDKKALQKARIRARYKGASTNNVTVIPAAPKKDMFSEDEELRVAVYARVSTDETQQTSSFELQKNYYKDMVGKHPLWTLVDIYADEGISGTSLKHRDNFRRMIADAKAGKIDLIITKSVSRFARNTEDFIHIVKELKLLKPPVGVWFETDNIYSLEDDKEMILTFAAQMAQEESHIKSKSLIRSYEMRYQMGIYPSTLMIGYDIDMETGLMVINEEEAKTIRFIFYLYLYGYRLSEIAETLKNYERATKQGNTTWNTSSIGEILKNEKYCGDYLAQKTYTIDYQQHLRGKNVDQKPKYFSTDHHPAIIRRDDYLAVQKMIANHLAGGSGIMPELHVIQEGRLAGFVSLHPRWAGFSLDEYEEACYTYTPKKDEKVRIIEAVPGDFDYRNYQIVPPEYFSGTGNITVQITRKKVRFNSVALEALNN